MNRNEKIVLGLTAGVAVCSTVLFAVTRKNIKKIGEIADKTETILDDMNNSN